MRTPSRALLASLASLTALVVLSGCGDDEDVATSPGTDGPTTTAAPEGAGGGGSQLLVQVATGGGFVPVEVNLGAFPELVVTEDGTAWTPGAQIAIFPPPAVPAVQRAELPPEDVAAIEARLAESAELFDGVDFGQPPVADFPSTTITARIGGGERTLEVYALGAPEAGQALTAEQRQARGAVEGLIADLRAIVEGPGRGWQLELTPQIRVSSIPVDDPSALDDPVGPIPWPAGVPEPEAAGGGRFGCVALSGPDRDAVLEAAGPATTMTVWELSDGPHQIVIRPLFPGEAPCP